jgi:hypothetical protein
MKRWLCAVGLALSLGCATAVVRPYVGDQQAWPTASGGIVNTKYALPVFTSLPPSSYDVLAELRISSPFYAQPEEGHMPRLVKKAKEIGADAIVFVQGKIFFSTNYGPRNGGTEDTGDQKQPTLTTVNTFNPESFQPEVTILAIRWTGQPPSGLPYHPGRTVIESKPTSAPAPEPVAIAPAATITNAPEKVEETPKVEEPSTNATPVAPTTNFEPGNSSSQ